MNLKFMKKVMKKRKKKLKIKEEERKKLSQVQVLQNKERGAVDKINKVEIQVTVSVERDKKKMMSTLQIQQLQIDLEKGKFFLKKIMNKI